jgi:GNAT superfamily N-acetyltransferase
MDFTIRKANKNDMPRVLELIQELATFEKEPNAVIVTVEQLQKDGFTGHRDFTCFVAETTNQIEGIALVFERYSTWKGKVIHLEDLIVNQKMRSNGIGTALLDKVIKYGAQLGVKRISWEVLDWNLPAINFYNQKGANVMEDWKVVHLNEEGINNYISKLK